MHGAGLLLLDGPVKVSLKRRYVGCRRFKGSLVLPSRCLCRRQLGGGGLQARNEFQCHRDGGLTSMRPLGERTQTCSCSKPGECVLHQRRERKDKSQRVNRQPPCLYLTPPHSLRYSSSISRCPRDVVAKLGRGHPMSHYTSCQDDLPLALNTPHPGMHLIQQDLLIKHVIVACNARDVVMPSAKDTPPYPGFYPRALQAGAHAATSPLRPPPP